MKEHALISAMIAYYAGDPKRIHHFLKVYAFAKAIGQEEGLDPETQATLETAALVHDIGIRPSEEKYGSSAGRYQEQEGPAPARAMLAALGVSPQRIDRVCYLVAHHHTYHPTDGADHQILLEADFLVNAYEDGLTEEAVRTAGQKLFRTAAGRRYLEEMYLARQTGAAPTHPAG